METVVSSPVTACRLNIARGTTDPEIDSETWTKLGNNMAPLALIANLAPLVIATLPKIPPTLGIELVVILISQSDTNQVLKKWTESGTQVYIDRPTTKMNHSIIIT